ncbi:MAG: hypothetical protein ABI867_37400 [Kofleriaceae bacterium]
MKAINTSFAYALLIGAAITGCAADPANPNPDDPNNPDDPSDPDDPLPPNVDASGKYAMQSHYDLATNAPGVAGDVVNAIIAGTDDPDDPTSWLLDQVINNMASGTIKNILVGAKPFVAGYLNDRLLSIAPDFVTTMVAVGDDFGQISKNFGLEETLDVAGSDGSWTSTHSVLGARFKIDNVESTYLFADYATANVAVPGVGMTVDQTGKLTLAQHTLPLQYGAILRIGLDAAIIPTLDPTAANLGQLLQHQVDCNAVGVAVNDAIVSQVGFGPGSGVFTTACNLGLQKAADLVYSKIADIDGDALNFGIAGTAKVLDKNQDNKLDTIQTGTWAGTLSYAGTPAPLSTATFFGARM